MGTHQGGAPNGPRFLLPGGSETRRRAHRRLPQPEHLRLFYVHFVERRKVVECGEQWELHVATSTAPAALPIVAPRLLTPQLLLSNLGLIPGQAATENTPST
jgi:hypothetical protein